MNMETSYNARCPAVKRLLREARELHESTEEYFAQPLEDNLFEWHFTVRGPPDTEFEGGIYHGRIIMPAEYPMKPPNIIFFTANGRFETNKKICLSISGHHPETWQPSWSIRTALLAMIGFMPTPGVGTIGGLDYTPPERKILAAKSSDYKCDLCGSVNSLLKERTGSNSDIQKEAKEVSQLIALTDKPTSTPKKEDTCNDETDASISDKFSSTTQNEPKSLENQDSTNDMSSSQPLAPSLSTSSQPVQARMHIEIPSRGPSLSLFVNNILITSAICVIIALILRRIFLLDVGNNNNDDGGELFL